MIPLNSPAIEWVQPFLDAFPSRDQMTAAQGDAGTLSHTSTSKEWRKKNFLNSHKTIKHQSARKMTMIYTNLYYTRK